MELEKFDLPENARMAIQLRRCEKRILDTSQKYAHNYQTKVDMWPERRGVEVLETEEPDEEITSVMEGVKIEEVPAEKLERLEKEVPAEKLERLEMTGN